MTLNTSQNVVEQNDHECVQNYLGGWGFTE
jgi:hypothetical protein